MTNGVYFTEPEPANAEGAPVSPVLRTLDDLLEPAIVCAERRASGDERPIPLPWLGVAAHFGGGLWPGVHFLIAGTGVGKTALALQVALHAAKLGSPVLYIGLELEPTQIALRVLGEQAGVPWSALYTGKAGPAYIERAKEAVTDLRGLPLHVEFGRPQGWPVGELGRFTEAMRAKYPEGKRGPGSRPLFVVLDFLQIVGTESDTGGRVPDLRERIGRAAYFARDVASRLDAAVLVVSSTARDKYGLLADAWTSAGLVWDEDPAGRPINRMVLKPDVLVGLGKESGEIEYSADSVSVLAPVPETRKPGGGCDVLFVTAKGRATGATWSPLHFSGHRYREADDGGSLTVEAMRAAADRRSSQREAKAKAKEDATAGKIVHDAAAVASYVLAHPRCTAREARVNAVSDNPRRWAPAVAKIGAALGEGPRAKGKGKGLVVDRAALPPDVAELLSVDASVDRGRSPPIPPPPSTSTVDGRGPTVDRGQRGPSTESTASTEGGQS